MRGNQRHPDEMFRALAARSELPPNAALQLQERGFVVLPGLISGNRMELVTKAYIAAIASGTGNDVRIGSTSTRVSALPALTAEFDDLYVIPELLEASCRVIGQPFKLSSFHARTLHPRAAAQQLHVDVPRNSAEWPLLGFILMVDEFRPDNGATRFVPGSHRWPDTGDGRLSDPTAEHPKQVLGCEEAGSLVIFNGSTWHGHTANTSDAPRRSLQGAFIPRDGRAAVDFSARMPVARRAQLGPLAKYALAL